MLVHARNPLNIGAAARAMSNFGYDDLRLVRPYDEAWREARSAVGAAAVLERATVCETVEEAAAGASLVVGTASIGRRDLKLTVRDLRGGCELLRASEGQTAILFGSEKTGLSNDDLSRCHWLMRIPTREEHESMNLGQAVAVTLYELARGAGTSTRGPKHNARVRTEDLERMEAMLASLLSDCGYWAGSAGTTPRLKLRRLLRGIDMSRTDAEILQGMLRQIRWKLDSINASHLPSVKPLE